MVPTECTDWCGGCHFICHISIMARQSKFQKKSMNQTIFSFSPRLTPAVKVSLCLPLPPLLVFLYYHYCRLPSISTTNVFYLTEALKLVVSTVTPNPPLCLIFIFKVDQSFILFSFCLAVKKMWEFKRKRAQLLIQWIGGEYNFL